MWPVMGEPPLLAGVNQERSIWVVPLAVAVRLIGAPGAMAAMVPLTGQRDSSRVSFSLPLSSYSISTRSASPTSFVVRV